MAVFNIREAEKWFIQGDPFVTKGLVSKWRLVEMECCLHLGSKRDNQIKASLKRSVSSFEIQSRGQLSTSSVPVGERISFLSLRRSQFCLPESVGDGGLSEWAKMKP